MVINVTKLLEDFIERDASDLYITYDAPPSFRVNSMIEPYSDDRLTDEDISAILKEIVTPAAIEEFEATLEYNTALHWRPSARFRINLFRQRQHTGIVMRRIRTDIPSLSSLHLPKIYGELVMEKRGLILVVGPTGSGKSTSLAAMLQHRNLYGTGHIVTIEDPIEFILDHQRCIITQRDIGMDTYSFGIALKNTLRQSPDVIVIGEIRDKETMEHAIVFAETGHLCLATLHANNANQAIERILNFFPEEKHAQVLLNLSLNLKAVMSQRLLPNTRGSRTIALEILRNQGIIRTLIKEGNVKEIKEFIEKGRDLGMQSFEQALIDLYTQGVITEDVALTEADNPANLRLAIQQYEVARRMQASKADNDFTLQNRERF
ncbi:MAG: PilT/PilU family type 4a pilus ATPase [Rickettsiales bacterium]|nr:PilT/PilU family type 4a pilus ATPase [Rickettsiales bacterium]